MASAPHRANILNGGFNRIGVGVKIDGAGRVWMVRVVRYQLAAPSWYCRGGVPALPPLGTGPVRPGGPVAFSFGFRLVEVRRPDV